MNDARAVGDNRLLVQFDVGDFADLRFVAAGKRRDFCRLRNYCTLILFSMS
jgi:hypothetical protein